MIVNITLGMVFSSGFPFLYVTIFGGLTLLYFVDKFLILRVLRKPKLSSQEIHERFLKLILVVVAIYS